MTAATAVDVQQLKASFTAAGQGHVFHFWDSLAPEEQQQLAAQLAKIDPVRVNKIHANAMRASKLDSSTLKVEPLPASAFLSAANASAADLAKYKDAGMQAIARGEVAVLLMAGGQGTRLGSKDPKGCYDIGLPSNKSLFHMQAERLRKLQQLAGANAVLPWYVMVSGPTRKDTVGFFEKNHYFGLDKKHVIFFEQGTLPALTVDGKIYLEAKSRVSEAPDGNGGVYAALQREGVLKDMRARGVKYVHAYCVDNCLVKVADPTFVGFNISRGCDVGAKTVTKTDPAEPVGVVCLRNGKYGVVEYSEIPASLAGARNEDGSLKLSAANIANHFYTVDFLERVEQIEDQLEYHVAHKKIAHVDIASGNAVAPKEPNGVKMELFIFDVFPFCDAAKFAVFEGDRSDEFSPLKNKEGPDSPATSRKAILDLHRRYLEAAGAQFKEGAEVEIAPLVSYAGEGLDKFKGRVFEGTVHMDA